MGKTRIGYIANLAHSQTKEYLSELIDLGLLEMVEYKPHSKSQKRGADVCSYLASRRMI
jgi:predicted transcriptional regulator